MASYSKIQNVAKSITYAGDRLNTLVLDTMTKISSIVGATLGPGGRPVLIERQDYGVLPMISKDGVTVCKALGFDNPHAQNVLESVRDSSVRTASEAGDGTTTSIVLAEAVIRNISKYCKENPSISPQQVVRELQGTLKDIIIPLIKQLSKKANMGTPEGVAMLKAVATISANGDKDLAEAVMQCFDLVGDDGNVTLTEINGASAYEIERIEGYPIPQGYEDSLGRFYPKFINDNNGQKCVLEDCYVLSYFGRLNDMGVLGHLINRIGENWINGKGRHNLIILATGFSEQVITSLAMSFPNPEYLNVVPVLCPQFPISDGQLQFLQDVCVVTGQSMLIDPLQYRLDEVELNQLGTAKSFEMGRFRSNIIGDFETNELNILERVDQIKRQIEAGTVGILETTYLNERIGKLTGGIARLKIIAPSAGELRERKDRAEDAVCAVRGAIKHGVLPGGGWTLMKLARAVESVSEVSEQILSTSFKEPLIRILNNMGYHDDQVSAVLNNGAYDEGEPLTFNAVNGKWVNAYKTGLLDSTPAVLEAIRNSISIATLLGTLGGIISFNRNNALELSEAKATQQFERDAGIQSPVVDEA